MGIVIHRSIKSPWYVEDLAQSSKPSSLTVQIVRVRRGVERRGVERSWTLRPLKKQI